MPSSGKREFLAHVIFVLFAGAYASHNGKIGEVAKQLTTCALLYSMTDKKRI
jgi:hypothetical protein